MSTVADWRIAVGQLFIRLGRCLPGLRPSFKDIFSEVYPQIFLLHEGILNIMGYVNQISSLKHAHAPFSHLVRKRQRKCRESKAKEKADVDHTVSLTWPRGSQESQEGREGTCGIGLFTLRSQQIFAVLPTEQIPILAPPHA